MFEHRPLSVARFSCKKDLVPAEWGKVAHGAEQPWQLSGDTIELQLKPRDARLSPGESLPGF